MPLYFCMNLERDGSVFPWYSYACMLSLYSLASLVVLALVCQQARAVAQPQSELDPAQIGRDPRISGPLLAAALAAGLTSKGVKVARFGYATTPAMFMSTIIQGETEHLTCAVNESKTQVGAYVLLVLV